MGTFYSMAIFSQRNKQTSLDYRNYDMQSPNRYIPFRLPKDIKQKLVTIANTLELKFCSFDIIYEKCGEYVFIEVNPEGQIGWLSHICNYTIEREIAQYILSTQKN